MADTIDFRPPPEHNDKSYHWAQQGDEEPEILHWNGEEWFFASGSGCELYFAPDDEQMERFRYIEPVAPPSTISARKDNG